MGILLGALAALLFGASDILAARGSRTDKPITVTRTALLVALIVTPLLLFLKPFSMSGTDWIYSIISGVATGFALVTLYIGYSRAQIGVVAPIASVLTAVVPVLFAFARGEGLSLLSGVGVLIGLGAVALSTYQPGGRGSMRVAFVCGVLAGSAFGLAFAMLALTNASAGLAPVPIQRLFGLLFLLAVHPLLRAPILSTRVPGRTYAIFCGITAGAAMGALQLGYRYGEAGPVSVAASQFAAFTVLLSAIFNHEKLRWWQVAGLAMASVGVAFMAAG